MSDSTAVTNAVALSSAASVVRNLHWLTDEHSVHVSLHTRFERREIDIHALTPGLLEEIVATYPDSELHHDADEILKYVVTELAGFTVTFFRR